MKLKNKLVLITGANRGMGKEFALEAHRRGAELILINRSSAAGLLDKIPGSREILMDLSLDHNYRELVVKLESEGLFVDVLINNAGLLVGGLLEEQDTEKLSKMMRVNLETPIKLTQAFLPGMTGRKSGMIVNNSSVSGIMTFPCATTYAASKSGLASFSNALREELRGTGVDVCLLYTPGVKTEMYDQISHDFSKNLDVSFLKSIPASDWAKIVFDKIEKGASEVRPQGTENIGLHLAQKMPGLFKSFFRSKFKREVP